MATGTQQRTIANPGAEKSREIKAALELRTQAVEMGLPSYMKGQGERLTAISLMYFNKKPDLHGIPPAEFVRCVMEAAQFGFAIDGKMAYVVKYKSVYEMQLSYMGLIAALKRCGSIGDISSDVVSRSDHFRAARYATGDILEHEYQLGADRSDIIGAYSRVREKGGLWTFEVMDRSELDRIQRRAPSKNGPWSTDTNEMRKKTVIRRHLKMYMDDPGVQRVIPHMGTDDDDDLQIESVATPRPTLAGLIAATEQQTEPPATWNESEFTAALEACKTAAEVEVIQSHYEPLAGAEAGKVAGACNQKLEAMKGGA